MPSRAPAKKAPAAKKRAPTRRAPRVRVEEEVDLDLDAMVPSKKPSFKFRVGGKTFRCRAKDDLHWDMVEKWLTVIDDADAGVIAANIDGFFDAVLMPEDLDAFTKLKADPKGPLSVARVVQLLITVNEKVFGIGGSVDPTKRPASSGGGSKARGRTSKASHNGRVTPRG